MVAKCRWFFLVIELFMHLGFLSYVLHTWEVFSCRCIKLNSISGKMMHDDNISFVSWLFASPWIFFFPSYIIWLSKISVQKIWLHFGYWFWQGRRWSDGLHQAVEAKEGLPIQNETVTLASISYQNFFLQVSKWFVFEFSSQCLSIHFARNFQPHSSWR